jgi:hypothetical protein
VQVVLQLQEEGEGEEEGGEGEEEEEEGQHRPTMRQSKTSQHCFSLLHILFILLT